MMRISSWQLLKHIAFIAKVVGFFPAIIIISLVMNASYQADKVPYQLTACLIMSYLGFLQMKYKDKLEEKIKGRIILKALILLGYVVTIGCIVLVTMKFMSGMFIYKLVFLAGSLFLYFMAIADYPKRYNAILSIEYITGVTAIYIIAISLSKIDYWGLIYIFIIGVYIFINNQSSLEKLLKQTRANTPMFKNIRNDNMKWVCLLVSLMFVGYPFRKQLGRLVKDVVMGILWLIIKFFQMIMDLLSWLLQSQDNEQVIENGVPPQQMEAAQENELAQRILFVLIAAALIFLIVKNRKRIADRIREEIEDFIRLLKRLFQFLFAKKGHAFYNHGEYIDTVERIDLGGMRIERTKTQLTKRRWEKQVKKYLKQLSANMNYREGYKLVLQGVKLKGIGLKPYETPREMMEIIKKGLALEQIEEGTYIYEKVRYNDKEAEQEEVSKIAELLRQMLVMEQ